MRNWSESEREAGRRWHERRPSVEWSYCCNAKALCDSLHTFWAQGFMEVMEGAFTGTSTPVICQIKECSGFNATSFLSTSLHGFSALEIARKTQC